MQIRFPAQRDGFHLPDAVADRNKAQTNIFPSLDDVFYHIQQLQAKVGADGDADPLTLDRRTAVIEAFITALQGLGVLNAPKFAALWLTGTLLVEGAATIGGILTAGEIQLVGQITKYLNATPLNGYALLSDGTAFVAGYPTFAQNTVLQPVGVCPPINATSVLTLTIGNSYFVNVGRIPKAITTIDVLYKVTTAGTSIIYAEVAIFKGAVVFNGAASLSRVGFTNVASVVNSTGIKKTTISLSGVNVGDDLWIGVAVSTSGVDPVIRATVADELQQGVFQTSSGQLSLMSVPTTVTLGAAATLIPWITAKWS